DTNIYDTGIYSISTPSDSMINTQVTIPKYTFGQKIISGIQTNLVNPYLDGSVLIVTKDSMGITEKQHFEIPGFTIAITSAKQDSTKYYYSIDKFFTNLDS